TSEQYLSRLGKSENKGRRLASFGRRGHDKNPFRMVPCRGRNTAGARDDFEIDWRLATGRLANGPHREKQTPCGDRTSARLVFGVTASRRVRFLRTPLYSA